MCVFVVFNLKLFYRCFHRGLLKSSTHKRQMAPSFESCHITHLLFSRSSCVTFPGPLWMPSCTCECLDFKECGWDFSSAQTLSVWSRFSPFDTELLAVIYRFYEDGASSWGILVASKEQISAACKQNPSNIPAVQPRPPAESCSIYVLLLQAAWHDATGRRNTVMPTT